MEPSSRKIHQEINALSHFRALFFVRIYILVFFLFFTFYSFLSHYPVYSLFLLIIYLPLPSILSAILQNGISKRAAFHGRREKKHSPAETVYFPVLCRKYHFSSLRYQSQLFAYFFIEFILVFWQRTLNQNPAGQVFLDILPMFLFFSSLYAYLILSLLFRLFIHRRFMNGTF